MSRLRDWAVRSTEMLDDPSADRGTVVASLHDIARINRAFGGAAAVTERLDEFYSAAPSGTTLSLLDVGTGTGDIPRAAARRAARRGISLRLVGLERHPAAACEAARPGGLGVVLADGGRLPFRGRSVDLVICAKLLHHLPGERGHALLREMDRVARLGVVVADIHRSALAAAGLWLVSFPLGLHPVTRRDGVISVFRGFTPAELREACAGAGIAASVRRHPLWCLTAAWRPNGVVA
jgi:SAM-dependent methyltransferase